MYMVNCKIMHKGLAKTKIDLELPAHCVSAGLGSHCPGVSVCSVSVQVLVVGPEGISPSSHWKVAIAPTVVPDTVVLVELDGNSGAPQSTRQVQLCLTIEWKDTC